MLFNCIDDGVLDDKLFANNNSCKWTIVLSIDKTFEICKLWEANYESRKQESQTVFSSFH